MPRIDLTPDCGACEALCCVATAFDASESFAFDKAAGERCGYLTSHHRCAIHTERVERGLSGCVAYECYGAGQYATRLVREELRHTAFLALRPIHEMLWLLTEAQKLCPESKPELIGRIDATVEELDALRRSDIAVVMETDQRLFHERAHGLLRQVGEALGGRRGWRRPLPVVAPPGYGLRRTG